MKNMIYRKHDEFYAKEYSRMPKESFVFGAALIRDFCAEKQDNFKILDIGCAVGDFPAYLIDSLDSRFTIVGMEYLHTLVITAKERYPHLEIFQGSIEDPNSVEPDSYDIITILGVISIFDELDGILKNISSWVRKDGRIFIHGMFNPDPVDVLVKYRLSSDLFGDVNFENGWNIISQESFRKLAMKYGASSVNFHKFNLSIDLDKQIDPIRSWTELLDSGDRQIVNGLCIKQPQYFAELTF